MPRIPITEPIFPDPALSESAIQERLSLHARRLEVRKRGLVVPDHLAAEGKLDEWQQRIALSRAVRERIARRAARIAARVDRQSPLSRLKREERDRFEGLRNGVDLVALPSEHRADEIAAELHAEFPWMGPATEAIWHGLRRSVQSGDAGLRLPPMLLDGPPGIGKSRWARRLAGLIGVPDLIFEATTENASFGLVGCQRGWANAVPGRLVNLILTRVVATPVVVVDEVEKAGEARSHQGRTFALTDALLPLLEPLSARRWSCPYFEVAFDMGWVIWVLSCNERRCLPEPLLSRCPAIRLESPSRDHLETFARREGARRDLSEAAIDAVCTAIHWAAVQGHRPDLRGVIRMLDRAEMMERRPVLQ
ncbi:AAA family ATPase [Rhodovulum euryhalinum]|uniref:ATPase family protein associated with various cellular activities (AAA) n=1 Tax=Rhodovulum euryhalinum TaxID=35805 RepID=A0A4R2KA93_9RHOB|nr:AAA family ATPase [Rhodovulum euryhalinum]TCO70381.1 ATPase family protein associated with various cellular activities (AAA) [Rhodovulum euryhalinum]